MSIAMEPATTAKVILHTAKGPIELELWAKEVPLACRNFIQLCQEGYYDGVKFHRVVKDFIVQSGDPTGTGHGGEAIYPEGRFENEFHTRLRFNRRGLLGCASMMDDDNIPMVNGELRRRKASDKVNGSQFFITLAAASELTNKSTLFGKVVGDTIFNVTKIGEGETDNNDRPIYPTTITRTEVVTPYFEDIVPRAKKSLLSSADNEKLSKKTKRKIVKLSFDDDEENDEEDGINIKPVITKKKLNKIKLSSDVIDLGPIKESNQTILMPKIEKVLIKEPSIEKEPDMIPSLKLESLLGKKKQEKPESERLKDEFEQLKSSMKRDFDARIDSKDVETKSIKPESAVSQERKKYTKNSERVLSTNKKEERELQTLELLSKFKSKLSSISQPDDNQNNKSITNSQSAPAPKKKKIKLSDLNSDDELPSDYNSDDYEIESDDDDNEGTDVKDTETFMSHKFEFDHTKSHLLNEDTLMTIDTREQRDSIRRKLDNRYTQRDPDSLMKPQGETTRKQ